MVVVGRKMATCGRRNKNKDQKNDKREGLVSIDCSWFPSIILGKYRLSLVSILNGWRW
jgi:hypothetical protein